MDFEKVKKEANKIIGSDIASLMNPDYPWSKSTARATLADKIRRRARNEPEVCRAMFHLIREADPDKKNIFTARNSIWEVENQLNEKAEQKKAAGEEETATGTKELYSGDNGISIVENKDIGRYQIIFPGRPDREIASKLKHNGWHWSPSNGAWQRQNTSNGEYSMKRMAETLGLSVKKSFTEQVMEIMEKGKAATLGEVRTWKDGKKYRKEVGGWKEVSEGGKEAKDKSKKIESDFDIDNLQASKRIIKLGDVVSFMDRDGAEKNGQVVSIGKDGVTVKNDSIAYQVLFKNVTKNITKEGNISPEKFNGSDYAKKYMDYEINTLEKANKGEGVNYFLEKYLPGEEGREMKEKCDEFEKKVNEQVAKEETVKKHRLEGDGVNAVYTDERTNRVHKKVFEHYLNAEKVKAATPKNGEKPQLVILGGRAGAGKSWFTDSGKGGLYEKDVAESKYIVLDADSIKEFLPEYEGWNAGTVHEESSDLNKKLIDRCKQLGVNVIIDGTMASPEKSVKQVQEFKDAGYTTSCDYMFTPMQESMKRACGRFKTRKEDYSGRFVPLGIMTGMTKNESSFEAVKNIVDRYSFRDNYNQTNGQPTLICQKGDY